MCRAIFYACVFFTCSICWIPGSIFLSSGSPDKHSLGLILIIVSAICGGVGCVYGLCSHTSENVECSDDCVEICIGCLYCDSDTD